VNQEDQLDEICRRLFKKPKKGVSLYQLILQYQSADERLKLERELREALKERRENKYFKQGDSGGVFRLDKPRSTANVDLLVSAVKQLKIYSDSRSHAKGGRVSVGCTRFCRHGLKHIALIQSSPG
jgi:hypothetical protein